MKDWLFAFETQLEQEPHQLKTYEPLGEKQEELRLQIASQSDPAWVELLIKKQLGMVPSGQTKVYFEE